MLLRPPVEPMLAQGAEALPGPAVLRAGVAHEPKLDGHRTMLFTPAGPGGRVLLQSRRGSLVQDRGPDLVAAAEAQLPAGLVLDGELLVWDVEAGHLSFEALEPLPYRFWSAWVRVRRLGRAIFGLSVHENRASDTARGCRDLEHNGRPYRRHPGTSTAETTQHLVAPPKRRPHA